MKSLNLILSTLAAAVIGFGCGGASTVAGAEEPAPTVTEEASESATDALAASSDEDIGESMASEATGGMNATVLGPQITSGTVRFNFKPTGRAKKIFLAGNFNGWDNSNSAYLLSDGDGDGIYSLTIELDPGTYQYKLVIDGQWTKDPHAPGSHPDGFGGENGKFEVK